MRKIILAGTSLSLAVALSHCVGDSTATGNDADSGSGTDGSTQQGADSGGQNGMDGSMNSADTGVDAGPLVTGRFISDYIIPDATPGSIGYIATSPSPARTSSSPVSSPAP